MKKNKKNITQGNYDKLNRKGRRMFDYIIVKEIKFAKNYVGKGIEIKKYEN